MNLERLEHKMELLVTVSNSIDILIVDGRIDTTTAPIFSAKLDEVIGGERQVVLIDFLDVRYISSVGFRTLLVAERKLASLGGRLAICSLNPTCQRLFGLGGFTTIFPNFPSRNEAVAGLTVEVA